MIKGKPKQNPIFSTSLHRHFQKEIFLNRSFSVAEKKLVFAAAPSPIPGSPEGNPAIPETLQVNPQQMIEEFLRNFETKLTEHELTDTCLLQEAKQLRADGWFNRRQLLEFALEWQKIDLRSQLPSVEKTKLKSDMKVFIEVFNNVCHMAQKTRKTLKDLDNRLGMLGVDLDLELLTTHIRSGYIDQKDLDYLKQQSIKNAQTLDKVLVEICAKAKERYESLRKNSFYLNGLNWTIYLINPHNQEEIVSDHDDITGIRQGVLDKFPQAAKSFHPHKKQGMKIEYTEYSLKSVLKKLAFDKSGKFDEAALTRIVQEINQNLIRRETNRGGKKVKIWITSFSATPPPRLGTPSPPVELELIYNQPEDDLGKFSLFLKE